VSELVPFERYRNGHVITIPVLVGGSIPTRFVLDTGIGMNLVSTRLCERLGCAPTGEVSSGRRMSGQVVSAPLTRLPSISVGSLRKEDVLAGMLDFAAFVPNGSGIEGFLAPPFFAPRAFALNSITRTLRVELDGREAPRVRGAAAVPVQIVREGRAESYFVDLTLPSGSVAHVEVDTGSDTLILHSRYMRELGVNPERADVRTVEGKDETGHRYVRYFGPVRGTVRLAAAPTILQHDPDVMFQEIIYDGLLGDAFLRSYEVTYDFARSQIILADPSL
jgi:hypothetical protein